MQQGLLRALARALQELLETATDSYTAHVLEALSCAGEARGALAAAHPPAGRECRACLGRRIATRPAWALTLGVPQALLAAA